MSDVPRPVTKLTAEQQEALAAAIKAAEKSRQRQQEADAEKELAWQALLAARNVGVPDDLLCKQTRFSRATLNRKYGPRPEDLTE